MPSLSVRGYGPSAGEITVILPGLGVSRHTFMYGQPALLAEALE